MSKRAGLIQFSLGMLAFTAIGSIGAILGGYVVPGVVYAGVMIVVWVLCLGIIRRA